MIPSKSALALRPAVASDNVAFGWVMTARPNATDPSVITGEKTMPLMPIVALAF